MPTDSNTDGPTPVSRVRTSASTASTLGYPLGHLGHLNLAQEEALEQFKATLLKHGLWKPGPPASHDDQTLLRYLRARRWIVQDALGQFKDTEEWRAANDIDVLYETIELDAYEQSRRLYPQWTGRRDRRGIPLYVFEIRTLDSKTLSTYERLGSKETFSQAKTDGQTSPGLLRLFALYENLTRFSQPFCTQLTADREHSDVPVTMSTNIVDIEGVGLKQFWNLKGHMQAASQLATAHYPETLDRIFIIGAPGFFSTVWGWIKRWFDPITVSKIFVLSPAEVKPTLEAFIDPRNIPRKYGGQLDYQFGQLGIPDPHWDGIVSWENGHSQFPSGPLVWENEGDDRVVCIALGSEKGVPRRQRVCTIPRSWDSPSAEKSSGEEVETAGTNTTAPTTVGSETQDDTTQTDGTVEALEKLNIDEKAHAEVQTVVPTPVA